ncbi:hypothetical protein [Massilia sp. HP4]|uniref:hypothetical protein n=1 Tax=Massilia sp. HP4 TaxID=2562316 RepID=UPI0010C11894|nr:hypothetical protein [Massilia sp. HP4]
MSIQKIFENFSNWPNSVALGISSLESIANLQLWPNGEAEVAIPDNLARLLDLIRDGSQEHRTFLARIIRYFRGGYYRPTSQYESYDDVLVDRIIEFIENLRITGRLVIIGDDNSDPEISNALRKLYPGKAFEISLSPKRNFVRDYLIRIYSWSKAKGGLVLERTRRVFSDMGHHITALQIPDNLDRHIDLKSRYIQNIFNFKGGKTAKFFLGCAVSIAGLEHYSAGIVGVAIAFTDP